MNHAQALALSRAMDCGRTSCKYCGRKLATQYDSDVFAACDDGPVGGERPDLCWGSDDICIAHRDLHLAVVGMFDMKIMPEEIRRSFNHSFGRVLTKDRG